MAQPAAAAANATPAAIRDLRTRKCLRNRKMDVGRCFPELSTQNPLVGDRDRRAARSGVASGSAAPRHSGQAFSSTPNSAGRHAQAPDLTRSSPLLDTARHGQVAYLTHTFGALKSWRNSK